MDLKQQILVALGLDKQEEVNLEFQAKLEDGTIIVSTADSLEAGVDVSVLTEDGTTMLLPVGEYRLEDGMGIKVEEEGVVAEIIETEEEVVEEEATEETEKEEMNEEITEEVEETEAVEFDSVAFMDEVKSVVVDLMSNVNTEIENLKSELAELKSTNEELSSEKEKLSAQVVELSNEPAANPVDINKFSALGKEITSRDLSKMSKRERILYNITK
mgnify:CR=1 FL=1|jgi:hypothetical protein|tara:strand:+ start:683 stop:1330 length:648 start_codon:yes stop_codon:yes gene_type:complete